MAQYDGSIRIGTEITTKQAEKELKSLEGSVAKTAEKIASLRSKMDALKDTKIPTTEYQNLQKEIESAEKKLVSLYDKQERFLETGGKESSPAYQKMVYDVETLEKKLQYAEQAMQNLVNSGKSFTLGSDTDKYAQMSAEIQQLNHKMESDTQRQSELQSQLSAEEQRLVDIKAKSAVSDQEIINLLERRRELISQIKGMEAAGVGLGYQGYEKANAELAGIDAKIKEYKNSLSDLPQRFSAIRESSQKAFNAISGGFSTFGKVGKTIFGSLAGAAKNAFSSIGSGAKKSGGILSTFASRLKGIALSLLIFNWISKGFNAMISGMKKGFENFMGYSDSYAQSVQNMKNAMSTLGNQFAAAFAPIVQMVIPWLNSLINAITNAISYASQFFAVLGGKSTFTKATQIQDKYNKSLGGTAKAAKKAAGALASFDTLEVLNKKDDGVGGGGAGDGSTSPEDMFEEVPVDQKVTKWLDDVKNKLKPILDYLDKLKGIFMQGFWDGLGDWEYRWDSIKDSVKSIKESLIDIFTDPAVIAAATKYIESVAYMFGSLVGSMASIGLTIAANLLGGISKYLEQNKDRIKEYLISMFNIWEEVNYMFSDLFQSIAYVFEAFASEQGQQLTANIIGIFVDAFMGITELASKLFRDIANIIIQPFVENKEGFRTALEGFLGVLAEVTGTIKQGIDETFDKLNEVYDEHFKPFFDSVAQGLSDLVGQFLEFWNGTMQPTLDNMAELFSNVWSNHIQPFINNFIELLGDLADMLKALWENILKPLIEWIIDIAGPLIAVAVGAISSVFMGLLSTVTDVASMIIDGIQNIVNFLTNVFQGNWEAAWNNIVNFLIGPIAQNMRESGKNIIEGIKNGIIDAWESLKKTISDVAGSVSERFKSVLGIHSPSTVMDENGVYLIEGLKNGISGAIGSVYDMFSVDKWVEIGQNMITGLTPSIEAIKQMFLVGFSESFSSVYEQMTLFLETWTEMFTVWQEENGETFFSYDYWYEQFSNILVAYTDMFAEFSAQWQSDMNLWWATMVTPFFELTKWKTFGMQMKNGIISGFKVIVNEIGGLLNRIIGLFNAAFKELESAMNDLIDDYNSKASVLGTSTLSRVRYSSMASIKVPALASGAVIRGGNPFMAILGDQPTGVTNVETPLPTMVDAFKQAIAEMGGSEHEQVPVNINLNYNGETFARLSIPDILGELNRQGYDITALMGNG